MKFSQPFYNFQVSENLRVGTLVTQQTHINVSAINYELSGIHDCVKSFWIDPFTGIILTLVCSEFEITEKNHCEGDLFEHSETNHNFLHN